MKKPSTYILIIAIVIVAFYLWPSKEVIQPAGVLIQEAPYQKKIKKAKVWDKDEYKFKSLAEFKMKARVLSIESYSYDRGADISPYDLALGWGPMSDQAVVDKIDISQRSRWYYWKTDKYPIPKRDIQKYSANMHIIPATEEIEDELDKIVRGNFIEFEGYLVQVNGVDGFTWRSSLSREDTGGGACELVWIEKLSILQ